MFHCLPSLGSCEFCRIGWTGGQDGGTSKSKPTQPRSATTRVTLYWSCICYHEHATSSTSSVLFQRIHWRHQFESELNKQERSLGIQVYHRPVVTVALRRLKETRGQVCARSGCPSKSSLHICRIWFVKVNTPNRVRSASSSPDLFRWKLSFVGYVAHPAQAELTRSSTAVNSQARVARGCYHTFNFLILSCYLGHRKIYCRSPTQARTHRHVGKKSLA